MSRSIKVRQACIDTVKHSVRRSGFLTQRSLAEETDISLATVSKFLTGGPVDRAIFQELCDKLSLDWKAIADLSPEPDDPLSQPTLAAIAPPPTAAPAPPQTPRREDWGDAMDVFTFYGRTQELATLEHLILQERCRLVCLIGMGGIGKTALSLKLAEQIKDGFEVVIWRSLRNAPLLPDLLADILRVLNCQGEMDLPEAIGSRITRLIEQLRNARCLLVLDNAESILDTGDRAGSYRDGYEIYGQFFQSVGEGRHQSCLVLTSRELPGGLAAKVGKATPIRSLQLAGLDVDTAQSILEEKGLSPLETNSRTLVEHYSGNPLALKIASTAIQDVFAGDITQFLEQGTVVFGDISDLLEQQFNRLTGLEQQVMIWLAIAREWVSLTNLREDILPPVAPRVLLESLESLQQRSLIEKTTSPLPEKVALFTQQPVVMEYVTERLIDQVYQELIKGEIHLFDSHALSKADTQDYLRNAQLRLILRPLLEQLQAHLGDREAVKACLDKILLMLKARTYQSPGYAAGNLLNLLNQLGVNLGGYDFSHLIVWQVYLQGVNLPRVNFAHADLTRSVFTQTMGDILSIAFSPDGTLLATGIDNQILLWRIADRRQIATLEGHSAWVRCLAFSADSKLLASGSLDNTIQLWDIETGQCLKTLRGHTSNIQSLAFTASSEETGQFLASGSSDHTIRLWDVQTRQCVQTLKGHSDRILRVILTPDQQTLISTSTDQTIRFWDTQSGECRKTIETHTNWILSAALSPDGSILVTGSNNQTVKFWDMQTGECVGELPDYRNTVWSVAFSPDGELLATGGADQTIRLWDVRTRQCLKTFQEHTNQVWLVEFSPDGRTLVSGGEDQTVKLWDVQSGHCLTTIKSHQNWVAAIAISPDGRTLVSGSKDQQLRLWDLETGLCQKTQKAHNDVVTAVAFSPAFSSPSRSGSTGNLLASGSDDHTIKLWNAHSLECLKTLHGHTGWVQAIAFHPTGQQLVSGSSDHTVKLWDVRSGECLHTLEGHRQQVKAVAFDPSGKVIASGSDDHTVKLWDAATGRCLKTLEGHSDRVLSVSYSPDGRLLASGSCDRTIELWDVQTGKCLRTLEGHSDRVRSVAFSSSALNNDEQVLLLASGGEDCCVKLWNAFTGECLRTLQGHEQIVWMVTFNQDGAIIASCSDDGTVQIWDSMTGESLKVLSADRPYEGMNISGAIGLTYAQQTTLCALGAIVE